MAARTPKALQSVSALDPVGARTSSAVSNVGSKAGGQVLLAWVEVRPKISFPKSPSPPLDMSNGLSPAVALATANPVRLLTVRDVAAHFQVSEKTIRRLIKAGDLPFVRVGRSIRIHSEVIENIVRQDE
jgi:excisionase family DNA binding protein